MITVINKSKIKHSILLPIFVCLVVATQFLGCKEDISFVSKNNFVPIKEPQLVWSIIDKIDSVFQLKIVLRDSGSRTIKNIEFEYSEDSLFILNKKTKNLSLTLNKPLELDLSELKKNKKYWGRVTITSDIDIFYFNGVLQTNEPMYPTNTIHCDASNPTFVKEVLNPKTGRIWMDRNLGARRAAISRNDEQAYGDLYQWGRLADGHQCRNSTISNSLSSSDQPQQGLFITSSTDWRNPNNNNLWQGVIGINNPCPTGYRIPNEGEFNAERLSWSSNDNVGAFNSPLKITAGGRRNSDGTFEDVGKDGGYWTSTVSTSNGQNISLRLAFNEQAAFLDAIQRIRGFSVRCIKN